MTFFAESNPDARISTPSEIAIGPRTGFLRSLQLAREQEIRSQNQLSTEYSMLRQEEDNFSAMEALGMHRPQTLSEIVTDLAEEEVASGPARTGFARLTPEFKITNRGPSGGIAQNLVTMFLAGELEGEEGEGAFAEAVRRYDAQFGVLRDRPTGPTAEEFSARSLYEGAINRGRLAAAEFDRAQTSTAGDLGIFVGGMIGAFDPDTSPLVAVSLPVGGFGKTLTRRVASEFAVQGALETGLMFAGQFKSRRRFNPNFGVAQAATEVLAAAAFGGTFQGVVEGGVAVARRFFRDTPTDPGPTPEQTRVATEPPPPVTTAQDIRVVNILEDFDTFMEVMNAEHVYGDSRLGKTAMRNELDAVVAQLGPFDGVKPSEVRPFRGSATPRTATRIPESVEGVNFGRNVGDLTQRISTIDERALEIEPVAVERFNRLTAQRDRLLAQLAAKQAIEQSVPIRPTPETLPANRANRARQDAARAQERAARDVETARLRAVRPVEADIRLTLETVNRARARIAPVVLRAYAAARDEFVDLPASVDALAQLDALLNRAAPPEGSGAIHVEVPTRTTIDQGGPVNTGTPDAPTGGQGGRVRTAEQIDQVDVALREQTDAELASIEAQVAEEGSTGFVIGGRKIELDDELSLPTEDGGSRTITVKQMLAEAQEDADIMQTVVACRIS